MTIKKMDATLQLEIKPGQYICKHSIIEDGLCGSPKLVESTSSTRVYLKGEDDRTTYISKSSVIFVCDTKAEADSMYALSKQQEAQLRSTKLAILEEYMTRANQMVG